MHPSRLGLIAACAAAICVPAASGAQTSGQPDVASSALASAFGSVEPTESRPASHEDNPRQPATGPGSRLRGMVIVIDPGHQLGNSRHPSETNRQVDAGGFHKACNTSGTSTNSGFPEATFTWRTSLALKRQLTSRGATVYLTRTTNSYDDWGPCINTRGRTGNHVHADAIVSIHGDGAASDVRGFFVITPADGRDGMHDSSRASHRYGLHIKRGLIRAGAVPSTIGDALYARDDLGTLNWSNRPIVMVELANMRNQVDARHTMSPSYRSRVYARGLRFGIVDFLLDH